LLTADSNDSPNSTETGPGRFKFKNDTLVSDYVSIDSANDIDIYFLLAESRGRPETDPLVIWFQGGPGCSSMLGLWTENGPYNYKYNASSIADRVVFEYNEHSWNNHANVLYID
jgi:carboxypeptidase C (cathepsin A)